MRIKFFAILLVFCSSVSVFASSNIDDDSKIETLTKEVQALLNRIELLEHDLSNIKNRIESINISSVGSPNLVQNDPIITKPDGSMIGNIDVFDEATNKEVSDPYKDDISKTQAHGDVSQDKQLYDLSLASLKDNKLKEAEGEFSSFLQKYPNSKLRSNAYFWYGEVFFKEKIFDKASINYLKGYKQSPKGPKAADSLLKLALSLGELNKKKDACAMLSKLEAEFPSRAASSVKRAKDAKIKFGCSR